MQSLTGNLPKKSSTKEPKDFYEDVLLLIGKLRKKEITGIVLDELTVWHLKSASLLMIKV